MVKYVQRYKLQSKGLKMILDTRFFSVKYLVLSLACLSFLPVSQDMQAKESQNTHKKAHTMKHTIGFVDYQQLMSLDQAGSNTAVDEWNDGVETVKESLKPFDEELKKLDSQYAKLAEEVKSMQKSELTSKAALQRKFEEVARLEQELRGKIQQREQIVNQKIGQLRDKVKPKIDIIVEDMFKTGEFEVILKVQQDAVLASPEANLTKRVFKKANERYAEALKAEKEKQKKEAEKGNQQKDAGKEVSA
jgi:Skp family chaperone for outer membrane proteins